MRDSSVGPILVSGSTGFTGYEVARHLAREGRRLRRRPSLMTPGTVIGWNLNLEIEPHCLWSELGREPLYSTITTGIPAVLDECVAFQWVHPVEGPLDW